MNPALITQLIDLAIALAQTQLSGDDKAKALLGIIQRAVQAYQQHTGEPIDPSLIQQENALG